MSLGSGSSQWVGNCEVMPSHRQDFKTLERTRKPM